MFQIFSRRVLHGTFFLKQIELVVKSDYFLNLISILLFIVIVWPHGTCIYIVILISPNFCQRFLRNQVVYASDLGVESISITKSDA